MVLINTRLSTRAPHYHSQENPAEFTPPPHTSRHHTAQHSTGTRTDTSTAQWFLGGKCLVFINTVVQCVSDTVAMSGNVLRCVYARLQCGAGAVWVQQCLKGWGNTQPAQVSQATWRTPLTEIENALNTHAHRLMYCLPRDPSHYWPTKSRHPIVKVALPVF